MEKNGYCGRDIDLGKINLDGRVIVTDPCYSIGTWCQESLNILPGTYRCKAVSRVSDWGDERISHIWVRHEGYKRRFTDLISSRIGVDSGQVGIFPLDYYEINHENVEEAEDGWYRRVCDITLADQGCGTIDGVGVVSSSGYGDGMYDLYACYNDEGIIVGLKIDFLV